MIKNTCSAIYCFFLVCYYWIALLFCYYATTRKLQWDIEILQNPFDKSPDALFFSLLPLFTISIFLLFPSTLSHFLFLQLHFSFLSFSDCSLQLAFLSFLSDIISDFITDFIFPPCFSTDFNSLPLRGFELEPLFHKATALSTELMSLSLN